MTFEFMLTPDDLREAMSRPGGRWRSYLNLALWALYAAVAVLMAADALGISAATARAAGGPTPPEQNLWVGLAPSLVGLTLVVGTAVLARRRAGRRDPFGPAGRRRSSRGGSVVSLLAAAWIALANLPSLAIHWHPTPGRLLWAGGAVWFAYLGFTITLSLSHARHLANTLRAAQPALTQPYAITVNADGVTAIQTSVEHRFQWTYFARYRETANLILLMESTDAITLILSKRALPGAASQEHLRALIQTNIAQGTFMPRDVAFPVVPVPARPSGDA